MPVPYRITIRVAQDTLRKLEKLVESYDYESVSDIIRKAAYQTSSEKRLMSL